ncbi:glycosyltransferase [Thiocapsa marina]|uniref:Glycosyl transferase, group 1 n=1 Tax=Thiocapsa marina 5811 TaxID=768671 RepID=F9U9F3_9GAMM|nr:glycosyltransferase [Thiocapsa marina]EGV19411.1 glycosyl transferase, group 1 [Thiocapsa marina 5811]
MERSLRSLFRRLPLQDTRRQKIKAAIRSSRMPLFGRNGLEEPGWSQLVPPWTGDWSCLFPTPRVGAQDILVIDWKPPTPDRDSGSYRMRMILDVMREAGCGVDFIGDHDAEGVSYTRSLEKLGISVVIGREAAWRHLIVNGAMYRFVWISRPEIAERYLPMVRALAPRAEVIYDTVDLHWIRLRRGIPFSPEPEPLAHLAESFRRIEICNARCSDLTIAITEDEKRALLDEDPGIKVHVLPNIHAVSSVVAPVSGRSGLFFIGSFSHPPNIDAVFYFVRDILPRILDQIPTVHFYIVGSDMPYSIRALKSRCVRPVGYVRDVESWFRRMRVFVAPLRHGAGMKGKVGQSLALGLPVVTTSVGAEGMGLTHEVEAMVSEDPGDFASSVIRVCLDNDLWGRLSSAGQALVAQRFSKEAAERALIPLLRVEPLQRGMRCERD